MSGTYSGTTIDFFTFCSFVMRRSRRYVFPFESTTCQCGSGVCGGTKSSESVRVLLPFCVVCVTKPLFAFAPWNGPLLWLSWAKLLVAAMTSAVKEASMVLYIILVFLFGLFFAGGLARLRFTRFVVLASKSLQP